MPAIIGLCRVLCDGRFAESLSYSLEDAQVASTLKSLQINCKTYGGRPFGKIADLGRQLVRMRANIMMMHISPATCQAVLQLAKKLIQLKPNTEVVFWGETQSLQIKCLGSNARLIEGSSPLNVTQKLIQLFPDLTSQAPPKSLVSPYIDGSLVDTDLIRLGFTLKIPSALLEQEISWLAKVNSFGNTILIGASGIDAEKLSESLSLFSTLAGRHRFTLITDVAELHVNQLHEANVGCVGWVGLSEVADNVAICLKDSGIEFKLIDNAEVDKDKTAQYCGNGLHVMHNGFYMDAIQQPATYHLELSSKLTKTQKQKALDWCSEHMTLRSAVAMHTQNQTCGKSLNWPPHTYLLSLDKGGEGTVNFDHHEGRKSIRKLGYAEFIQSQLLPHTTHYVSISNAEDVEALVTRLEEFYQNGKVKVLGPDYPVVFENTCRWSRTNACKAPLLRRLTIKPDEAIVSCRDSKPIGRVGDDFDTLSNAITSKQQLEIVARECTTCPVRDNCSQCSQLPQSLNNQYCDIRKRFPNLTLFFEMNAFTHLIKHYLPASCDHLDLRISYPGLPPIYYDGPVGKARAGIAPVIVKLQGKVYLWKRDKQTILSVSSAIALMIEAWWMGASNQDIAKSLSRVFEVDQDMSESSLEIGLTKLNEQGVLNA